LRSALRAQRYLVLLAKEPDRSLHSLVNDIGNLPKAAPLPFADLLRAALIKHTTQRRSNPYEDDLHGPFSYIDNFFYPPVDKTEPFAGLLTNAPVTGLALIRDVVAHAVNTLARGKPSGDDGITLVIGGQERFFPDQHLPMGARRGAQRCGSGTRRTQDLGYRPCRTR
jgi:hypothetical protein